MSNRGRSKLALKETLREFHRLSAQQNEEENALSRLIPSGLTIPTLNETQEKRQSEYLNAPRPKEAELLRFLEQLPTAEVMIVAALMDSGRDHTELDLQARTSTEDAIGSIMEKMPRSDYVAAGESRVGDVNALVKDWTQLNAQIKRPN